MLIAFHTKHIMGAQSVKAGLPLRAGFIELAEQKAQRRVCKGAGCEGSGGGSSSPGGQTPAPRRPVAAWVGATASPSLGGFPCAAGSLKE